jgi:hypothetical protein
LAKIYRYTAKELQAVNDSPKEWRAEVLHIMFTLKMGYFEQGYNAISARTATDVFLNTDEVLLVIGDTWIAGFTTENPWHVTDRFLCEEFFGPRIGKTLDLGDFIDGGCALGKLEGCRFLEFGTRSNTRHTALARLAERHGAEISAITLRKEI